MSTRDTADAVRAALRAPIFAMLQQHGVETVELAYYGGGDEGNVTDVDVTYVDGYDGDKLPLGGVPDWARDWMAPRYAAQPRGQNLSPDPTLEEILSEPIWDRWGGFDGPDETEGKLMWTVGDRTVVDRFSRRVWEDGQEPA